MQKRVSRMSRPAARAVAMNVRPKGPTAATDRCMMRFVQSAELRPRYPLNPEMTDQSTATLVIRPGEGNPRAKDTLCQHESIGQIAPDVCSGVFLFACTFQSIGNRLTFAFFMPFQFVGFYKYPEFPSNPEGYFVVRISVPMGFFQLST